MVCPKMWRLGIHSNLLMVHHGTTGSDEHIEARSQLEFDLHQPGAVGVTTMCGAGSHHDDKDNDNDDNHNHNQNQNLPAWQKEP